MSNDTPSIQPLTLSVADAAEMLGTSEYGVRRLLAEKRLRCVRFGTTIRVPVSAIHEFLDTPTEHTPSGSMGRGRRYASRRAPARPPQYASSR